MILIIQGRLLFFFFLSLESFSFFFLKFLMLLILSISPILLLILPFYLYTRESFWILEAVRLSDLFFLESDLGLLWIPFGFLGLLYVLCPFHGVSSFLLFWVLNLWVIWLMRWMWHYSVCEMGCWALFLVCLVNVAKWIKGSKLNHFSVVWMLICFVFNGVDHSMEISRSQWFNAFSQL